MNKVAKKIPVKIKLLENKMKNELILNVKNVV